MPLMAQLSAVHALIWPDDADDVVLRQQEIAQAAKVRRDGARQRDRQDVTGQLPPYRFHPSCR
jgi:hypothetical protein